MGMQSAVYKAVYAKVCLDCTQAQEQTLSDMYLIRQSKAGGGCSRRKKSFAFAAHTGDLHMQLPVSNHALQLALQDPQTCCMA